MRLKCLVLHIYQNSLNESTLDVLFYLLFDAKLWHAYTTIKYLLIYDSISLID